MRPQNEERLRDKYCIPAASVWLEAACAVPPASRWLRGASRIFMADFCRLLRSAVENIHCTARPPMM
eukprot:3720407-Pleurochrysis_carterae.AAC.3